MRRKRKEKEKKEREKQCNKKIKVDGSATKSEK